MNFNDLLAGKGIDPEGVVVLRHRPDEPQLRRVLPWLAAEHHHLFNAFQSTHGPSVQASLTRASYVASFIGHEPGRALFVGLYRVDGSTPMTFEQFWQVPEYVEMRDRFGMRGWTKVQDRQSILFFKLAQADFYAEWKGRLVVGWPGIERNWRRCASGVDFPVLAIHEDSALVTDMLDWREIVLPWEQLKVLPVKWQSALEQWRAIYYIFDSSDGKGYVGSAYGAENLHSRWLNYAATGHGGNCLLRERDPKHFRFSILQLLAPDMDAADVIRLEGTWKERLHTRAPLGLNDN
ncbi:MAG: GIY-YIG nuclease family protein [Methyloceanibacter sp.]|uniref:GIY-YIG nuclease family protein n=1 Tax=Methyloceanibacter sp. TaxID=1965321 RepID=UPI003D6C932D